MPASTYGHIGSLERKLEGVELVGLQGGSPQIMVPAGQMGTTTRGKQMQDKIQFRILAERKTQVTLRRMQKDFLKSINANAVVLVLLATVTFAGFLQPPGELPFERKPGKYMSQSAATMVFIAFNSSAFYFAVSGLLLCVCSSLSPLAGKDSAKEDLLPTTSAAGHMPTTTTLHGMQTATPHGMETTTKQLTKQLAEFVASTLLKLICVNVLFAVALICCMGAYTAAGFSVTTNLHPHRLSGTRISVVVSSVVGVALFSIFMMWLFRDMRRFLIKALSHKSLSTSLQDRAGETQVQFRYLNADMSLDQS